RWGGEEFVMLLEGLEPENLDLFMEKVLCAVEESEIPVDDTRVGVTISIGATYLKEGDRSFEDGLNRADQALYESKREGKGRGTIRL
ncbi:MAG: GGDEF domain-containing protein, partial [Bacillota bacterium]